MLPWTTQLNSTPLQTSFASASSRLALFPVFFSLALFVAVGSEASTTLYCRQLRDWRTNAIYDRKWATAENGGTGGRLGDYKLFPQLEPYNYETTSSSSAWHYWPKRYSKANSPIVYTVISGTGQNISVPDSYSSQISNIINTIETQFDTASKRCAIDNISVSFTENGEPIINVTTFNYGSIYNGVVYTADENGTSIASYVDSTGYVPGYEPIGPAGSFQKVYYDVSQVSNGYALRLDSLSDVNSSSLQYDSSSGLYSYSSPDYSAILSSINEGVDKLSRRTITIDNLHLEIPAPEVTVNPEITVEAPQVTVTPDVTVNVTAPTQNDITVAIDNSDILASLDTLASDIEANTYYIQTMDVVNGNDLDLSSIPLTSEEQSLLAVPQQWNTQIPLIGDAADVAFGAFLGNIPDPGRQLRPLTFELFGFNLVIDFTPYSTFITWFRAFVLMAEFIWFLDCIWRSVVRVLSI